MVTVINAEGLVAGRLASVVAKRLLEGELIHIVNAEKAVVSGSREAVMERYRFKRYVGTRRMGPFLPRMPDRLLKRTVRGMLDYQSPKGRRIYKALRVYLGVPPEHKKATLETIPDASGASLVRKMTLGAISKELGAKFEV
ncbi:MAG: 50S ribosomal protein L13 [Methanobacteriota archaeon]